MEPILRFVFDIAQPSSQLALLLAAVLLLFLLGWNGYARRALAVFILAWLLYATPFVSGYFTDRLENHYPVLSGEELEQLTPMAEGDSLYIIVLGAGHSPDPRLKPGQMLNRNLTMRLTEAVRLYRELPGSKLVTSASAVHGTYSQAEALRDAAIGLGVNREDISIQEEPANTCEEARAFVRDHGEGARVIISTSALHQRRAMMLFEQQGASPVAAPAQFINKRYPARGFRVSDYVPSIENVTNLDRVMKEYAGYLWNSRRCVNRLDGKRVKLE